MSSRSGDGGADQGPRDWRRRRRSQPQAAPQSARQPEQPDDSQQLDGEEVVLSRPLVSVLEPALDAVAVYGAPLLIAGIIGLVTGIVVVAFVTSMRVYGYIDIAIGGGLIALVGVVFISNVVAAFLSRSGRYGINTLIVLGAFTAIVIIVNVISFENTSRMDVTATNQFSLASRTKNLLKDLDADVRVTAFYKETGQSDDRELVIRRARVKETLEAFDRRSGNFSYRIVDPDLEPEVVSDYFGLRSPSFVSEIIVVENLDTDKFDWFQRQPTDANYDQLESDLVTSTFVATGEEQKTIYFLTGHGERDVASATSAGYGAVALGLQEDNYEVRRLDLDQTEDQVVPDDAALVVIAGPTSELPESHQEALDLYLEGRTADGERRRENGSIIFLADPDSPPSFARFLAEWGVLLGRGYIRDLERARPGLPQTINLGPFLPRPLLDIGSPRGENLPPVFMPGATALAVPFGDDLRGALSLYETSDSSYLITDPGRTTPVTDGDNPDPRGPFTTAVLVRSVGKLGSPAPLGEPPESQISDILVFGDSDFLANSNFEVGGGRDLFLNSANFLVGDFSLVSLRPKTFAFREFNLDSNEYDFVRFSSWLFLPGIMALMAGFVWWVRR